MWLCLQRPSMRALFISLYNSFKELGGYTIRYLAQPFYPRGQLPRKGQLPSSIRTYLVVTLQGPAAVADVIAGARKKRKDFFRAKASKDSKVANSSQEATDDKKTSFPYCDQDITLDMVKLR